ncbi:hypothetical protein [Marisediminicola senii]|uniref:hypothetical protein n=1 Tax=Marisediminicola senii TaxID=2711233 RepID=UPI0013ECBAA1|nr:hypothetical protein [Marisediminicola senii]
MTDNVLRLDASCLLSKWGFNDGDIIFDWWWDHTNQDLPGTVDHHDVLRHLVRTALVPLIEAAGFTLDVYDIETCHNPIRTASVNFTPTHDVDPDIFGDIHVDILVDSLHQALTSPTPIEGPTRG